MPLSPQLRIRQFRIIPDPLVIPALLQLSIKEFSIFEIPAPNESPIEAY